MGRSHFDDENRLSSSSVSYNFASKLDNTNPSLDLIDHCLNLRCHQDNLSFHQNFDLFFLLRRWTGCAHISTSELVSQCVLNNLQFSIRGIATDLFSVPKLSFLTICDSVLKWNSPNPCSLYNLGVKQCFLFVSYQI